MPETAICVESTRTDHSHRGQAKVQANEPLMSHVLIAGGLGGAMGDTVMYPLDTIKTRQQGAPGVAKYRTMASTTKSILREEGLIRGVYRGYSAALLGSFPSTMIFFGVYENTKRYFKPQGGFDETLVHLGGGFLGDLVSSVVYVPSEVLKTRLQLQGPYNNPFFKSGYNYRGLTDACKTIARTEGLSTFFYGYKATLIRDLPFSALQFAFYEKFRSSAQRYSGTTDISLGLELATGGAAGGLAGVLTTPLDVIKTRIQTQTDGKIHGTVQGLRYIAQNEGVLRVFSGVGPRLVWTSIQSSVMLVCYQAVLKALDSKATNANAVMSSQ